MKLKQIWKMKTNMVITSDGSSTLFLADLGEHYHSINGAVQESEHVFINAGIKFCHKEKLNILEIGFGTGLNCLLTFREAHNNNLEINYVAIEKNPIPDTVWKQLNYEVVLEDKRNIFQKIHNSPWNCNCPIEYYGSLNKMDCDLFKVPFEVLPFFDLIYFDAFSPDKQPEMWQQEVFDTLFNKLNDRGILVTYCAKGEVRRKMKSAGFVVERIPGPLGKREMLRATKIKS